MQKAIGDFGTEDAKTSFYKMTHGGCHSMTPWLVLTCRQISQHSTAQHSTAQHSTAQHSTAQHSTAALTVLQVAAMAFNIHLSLQPEHARLCWQLLCNFSWQARCCIMLHHAAPHLACTAVAAATAVIPTPVGVRGSVSRVGASPTSTLTHASTEAEVAARLYPPSSSSTTADHQAATAGNQSPQPAAAAAAALKQDVDEAAWKLLVDKFPK
jgi:hypothetical protein